MSYNVLLNCPGNLRSTFLFWTVTDSVRDDLPNSQQNVLDKALQGGLLFIPSTDVFSIYIVYLRLKGQREKNKLYCPPGDIDHCHCGGNGRWPCSVDILPENILLSSLSLHLSVFLSLVQMSFDKVAVREISARVIGLHLGHEMVLGTINMGSQKPCAIVVQKPSPHWDSDHA